MALQIPNAKLEGNRRARYQRSASTGHRYPREKILRNVRDTTAIQRLSQPTKNHLESYIKYVYPFYPTFHLRDLSHWIAAFCKQHGRIGRDQHPNCQPGLSRKLQHSDAIVLLVLAVGEARAHVGNGIDRVTGIGDDGIAYESTYYTEAVPTIGSSDDGADLDHAQKLLLAGHYSALMGRMDDSFCYSSRADTVLRSLLNQHDVLLKEEIPESGHSDAASTLEKSRQRSMANEQKMTSKPQHSIVMAAWTCLRFQRNTFSTIYKQRIGLWKMEDSLPTLSEFSGKSVYGIELPRLTKNGGTGNLNTISVFYHALVSMEDLLSWSEQKVQEELELYKKMVDDWKNDLPDGLSFEKTQSLSLNPMRSWLNEKYLEVIDRIQRVDGERSVRPSDSREDCLQEGQVIPSKASRYLEWTGNYVMDGQNSQMMHWIAANRQDMRPGQYYPAGQHPGMYAPVATCNAGHAAMYSAISGTQWVQQPATTYAGHPSYTAAPSYGGHYGPGSQSETKPPESHATSQPLHHGNSYLAPYTGVQRDYSHSPSGTTLWSPYESLVQLGLSTFGHTNAPTGRPAYIEGSDLIPTSDYQFRQMYSAPQGHQSFPLQQHVLCPPSESYGMPGVLQSSTMQRSPHIAMESPSPVVPSSSTPVQTMVHDSYPCRSHGAPHSSYPSSDTNSLGVGGGASYVHSYDLFG
jgi:hypothetical protein